MTKDPPSPDNSAAMLAFANLITEINYKLGSDFADEKIFDYIFESLRLVIPYDRIGIGLLDEAGETITLHWVRSMVAVNHLRRGFSTKVANTSLGKMLESGEPRILNDLAAYLLENPTSESTRAVLKDGIRSSLSFPLRDSGAAVGVVFFSSCSPNSYHLEHVQIFAALASQFSVLVQRRRLKNTVERKDISGSSLRQVLHDMRGPLGVIEGYLAMLADEPGESSLNLNAAQIIDVFSRNTLYMRHLVEDLSELVSTKNAGSLISREQVNVSDFFAEICADAQVMAGHKGISFSSDKSGELGTVSFDRYKIRRAVDNFLSNAIKFSPRGSEVHLRVERIGKRLYFLVIDDGPGIFPLEIANLFREFGRTSNVPTEGEGSTGLGLAITKAFVTAHGGEVFVDSMPGKGSTFSFWIPACD